MAERSTTSAGRPLRHPLAGLLGATAAAAVLVVAASSSAGAAPSPTATASASPTTTASASTLTALQALATVTVKGRAPKTGYTRDRFGQAWADVDGNGCDTRNDVLARDLTAKTYVKGTKSCVVYSGTLADGYSGRSISFVRGPSTSTAVQIDHVVALSDAWQKGAQGWTVQRRTAFANDPLNLLAADGPLNGAKGDGDAATWLPPNRAFRCAYVARQVAVKVRYGLWMTQAERDASGAVLTACPKEPLPTGTTTAKATAKPTAEPTAKATAKPTAKPTAVVVSYQNCDAVRAAGKAPIRKGDPGFKPALDRDGDGVGCDR